MAIKAALLDENGIFLHIDTLKGPERLTSRHLPQITECDLPPGKCKWIPDAENKQFGGAFWHVDYLERIERTRREAELEQRSRGL